MFGQRRLMIALIAGCAATMIAGPRLARPAQQSEVTVTPLKPSGIYALGEKVGWTVTGPSGPYHYVIRTNNKDILADGEINVSGSATISVEVKQPAMLFMNLNIPNGQRSIPFGAAVEPTRLRPVLPKPRDFDRFWKEKIAGLEAIPANPVVTPGESYRPEVEYSTIRMDHVNGTHVFGQLAKPKKPGKYPAVLVLQWASPPYPLQKSWVIEHAKNGWLALNIEPHDVLPTADQSYYQALPRAIKNYASIGQDDREKSYFVEMYLRDYRAVDYLTHCPDWDGKTLLVMGTSMGGQQSLCVAGLHPRVTHVIVEEPAGCDMCAGLHGRQQGYPNFPTNDPKVMATAPYVDAVNFSMRNRATCLVAMGFVDTIAPPTGIWTAFNQIRGPKEAAPMLNAPHNNTATQEQQLPYTTRATEWMAELARGEKVRLNRAAW